MAPFLTPWVPSGTAPLSGGWGSRSGGRGSVGYKYAYLGDRDVSVWTVCVAPFRFLHLAASFRFPRTFRRSYRTPADDAHASSCACACLQHACLRHAYMLCWIELPTTTPPRKPPPSAALRVPCHTCGKPIQDHHMRCAAPGVFLAGGVHVDGSSHWIDLDDLETRCA